MTCRYCNHLDECENENGTPMATCKLDYHQVRTDIETCDDDTTNYECTEEFTLPFYDEWMNTTEEYGTVSVGSVWEVSDDNSEGDIRLNNISGSSDFPWIDISFEHLKDCFKESK